VRTNTWVDEGALTLKNGRTFGFRREAAYPNELTVNGVKFNLENCRTFVLHDDGSLKQLSIRIPLDEARDPDRLGQLIKE
jgi:hypothetical protein